MLPRGAGPGRACITMAPPGGGPRSAGVADTPGCTGSPADVVAGSDVADSDPGAAVAGASSPTTCVSDNCGFFLDSADTHQTAPATANTAITTSAGATNLLESTPVGAF